MNNDRFKFRVWDTDIKEYLVGEFLVGGCGDMIHNVVDYASFLNKGNYIIEQCTGLKDKNSNLIYEGDVVKNKTIEYVVKWESCCWVVESKNNVNIGGFLDDFLHCEIIGNIHEQKEQ